MIQEKIVVCKSKARGFVDIAFFISYVVILFEFLLVVYLSRLLKMLYCLIAMNDHQFFKESIPTRLLPRVASKFKLEPLSNIHVQFIPLSRFTSNYCLQTLESRVGRQL